LRISGGAEVNSQKSFAGIDVMAAGVAQVIGGGIEFGVTHQGEDVARRFFGVRATVFHLVHFGYWRF